MPVKVSVIVPVYQAQAYLKRCVSSLLEQTLSELEVILVDDGSRDGSGELCDAFAAEDSRVRVIHQENLGVCAARNAGIELAAGEYVGFADADDYVLPQMYERLYGGAKEYDADLVLSGVRHMGGVLFEDAGGEECKHQFSQPVLFEGREALEELLLGIVGALPREKEDSRYGYSVWKNLYRRQLLGPGRVEFSRERLTVLEDLLFLIDFVPTCAKAVGIPGAYYCYYHNAGSVSKSFQGERMDQLMGMLKEAERRLGESMPQERYRLQLDREIQAGGRMACIQEANHGRQLGLPRKEIRCRLRRICQDNTLSAALRRYPWWKLPWMQAAFAFAMRFRLTGLQWLLIALRARR